MDLPALSTFNLSEPEFRKYLRVKKWITDRLLYGTAILVFAIAYAFVLSTLLALKWNPVLSLSTSLPSAFIVTVVFTWLPFLLLRRAVGRLLSQVWPTYIKAVRYEQYCDAYKTWCEEQGVQPQLFPSAE